MAASLYILKINIFVQRTEMASFCLCGLKCGNVEIGTSLDQKPEG